MRKIKRLFILIILLSIGYIALDSFYLSLRTLRVETIQITNEHIPKSFNDSKIMIISDIYADNTNLGLLKKHVDQQSADIVVFLGNLLDEDAKISTELEATFKAIKAPLGKYAILSSDDYSQNEIVRKFLNDTNFRVIDTALIPIHRYTEESINLALFGAVDNNNARSAVNDQIDPNTFTLGLIHDPMAINGLNIENIDVWVAGKNNLGKINIPLYGSILYNDEPHEKVQLIHNTPLYITGGIGTNKPRVRLGSKPDIIILNLKSSL